VEVRKGMRVEEKGVEVLPGDEQEVSRKKSERRTNLMTRL
jgi:hypothetical protein